MNDMSNTSPHPREMPMPVLRRLPGIQLQVALLAMAALACGNEALTSSPVEDGSRLYWGLRLDHHAVNLSVHAPYDTIRLTATPVNSAGGPLDGMPAATFESGDPEVLEVTSEGVVRALSPASRIPVVATLSIANLTHLDTTLITITDDLAPPVLAVFSAHPVPPDSAKTTAGPGFFMPPKVLPVQALDAANQPMAGLEVDFRSSDTLRASINRSTGLVFGRRPGQVTLYATTTAYGVTKADTIPYTVGWPLHRTVPMYRSTPDGAMVPDFDPAEVWLGPGGTVVWVNFLGKEADVVFDDPASAVENTTYCTFFGLCGSGNIEPFNPPLDDPNFFAHARARRFPVPGTYTYHSAIYGITGKVIVMDQ
jgi:plastocyanin